MAKVENIGLICEQGDLGLHYTPLNESDKAIYEDSLKKEDDDKKKNNKNK